MGVYVCASVKSDPFWWSFNKTGNDNDGEDGGGDDDDDDDDDNDDNNDNYIDNDNLTKLEI